jgi:hypothetical protein
VIQGTLLDFQSSAKAFARRRVVAASQEKPLRRMALMAVWLALLICVAFFVLVILRSPVPIVLAMTAGISARCLGQHRNLKRIGNSAEAARLAAFEFDGERIHCSFDEAAVLRYVQSWRLRFAAAVVAGSTCFAMQYWSFLELSFLPAPVQSLRWLSAAIGVASPWLPAGAGMVFLWGKAPEKRWVEQVKAAIRTRTENSVRRILAPGEIDGLQAGTHILWQRLRLDRRGEYRAAIARHVRDRTAEAVLQSDGTAALLNATTELARQDLTNLGAAVATFHEVECRLRVLESMASELRDPLHEMRTEELKCELDQLSQLALHRRWDDLQRHSAWILGELDGLHVKLRQHAASVPAMVLPPGSDPYRLLGVSVDTPTPLIRKLRLRLAQLYHPDVSESISNSTKMAELNAAYDAVMKEREKGRR